MFRRKSYAVEQVLSPTKQQPVTVTVKVKASKKPCKKATTPKKIKTPKTIKSPRKSKKQGTPFKRFFGMVCSNIKRRLSRTSVAEKPFFYQEPGSPLRYTTHEDPDEWVRIEPEIELEIVNTVKQMERDMANRMGQIRKAVVCPPQTVQQQTCPAPVSTSIFQRPKSPKALAPKALPPVSQQQETGTCISQVRAVTTASSVASCGDTGTSPRLSPTVAKQPTVGTGQCASPGIVTTPVSQKPSVCPFQPVKTSPGKRPTRSTPVPTVTRPTTPVGSGAFTGTPMTHPAAASPGRIAPPCTPTAPAIPSPVCGAGDTPAISASSPAKMDLYDFSTDQWALPSRVGMTEEQFMNKQFAARQNIQALTEDPNCSMLASPTCRDFSVLDNALEGDELEEEVDDPELNKCAFFNVTRQQIPEITIEQLERAWEEFIKWDTQTNQEAALSKAPYGDTLSLYKDQPAYIGYSAFDSDAIHSEMVEKIFTEDTLRRYPHVPDEILSKAMVKLVKWELDDEQDIAQFRIENMDDMCPYS